MGRNALLPVFHGCSEIHVIQQLPYQSFVKSTVLIDRSRYSYSPHERRLPRSFNGKLFIKDQTTIASDFETGGQSAFASSDGSIDHAIGQIALYLQRGCLIKQPCALEFDDQLFTQLL